MGKAKAVCASHSSLNHYEREGVAEIHFKGSVFKGNLKYEDRMWSFMSIFVIWIRDEDLYLKS